MRISYRGSHLPQARARGALWTPAHLKRTGLVAGPLSQGLFSLLAEAGLPVVCVETRHVKSVLKAQINKTDRNDARGIARMMRVGVRCM
jgi:transposase